MREVKCDRCGLQIRYDPRAQVVLPMYSIFKKVDVQYGPVEVDLCSVCQRMFDRWLHFEYPYTGDKNESD